MTSLTRDDFEQWLFEMDDRLDKFIGIVPRNASMKMDYSVESLSLLENWLLTKYRSVNEILKESEKQILDMVARYVGETLRKNLGGIWTIDLNNETSVYYQMPVIEKQGCWTECPVTLVTASTDRRSGSYMAGVLNSIASRHGVA
jgi:hypothetical protein